MKYILVPFAFGAVLALIQFLAAVPWLSLIDRKMFRAAVRNPLAWLGVLGGIAAGGGLMLVFIRLVQDPENLLGWGKIYGLVLEAQLVVDFFVLFLPGLMLVWPRGAAVAYAAFREGLRQPQFWWIVAVLLLLMIASPFVPYFTFGEDSKMLKELGFDMITLAAVVEGVLLASISISDEIEGRTAITVMSKPVSRRQFLLGKFIGILMVCLVLTLMMGVLFQGVQWYKLWFEKETISNPAWAETGHTYWLAKLAFGEMPGERLHDSAAKVLYFTFGGGLWFDGVLENLPGLVFGFCQVTVLLAISVALATRLPMVVNLVTCLIVFILGHLTHVLASGALGKYKLVQFMANAFNTVLPGLSYFEMSSIIARDVPPDPSKFTLYVLSIVLYAALYSVVALLFGLILFEDRDLA
jgi:hypothetical protein